MDKIEFEEMIGGKFVKIEIEIDPEKREDWFRQACGRHVQRRLRLVLRNGRLTAPLEVLAKAMIAELKPDDLVNAMQSNEIENEALILAETDIAAALAKDGLPAPKNIRDHAMALVASRPEYMTQARARLVARAEVANETMNSAQIESDL